MELKEQSVSREIIFDGRIFKVAKDKSRLPDGKLADRELVLHTGGAGILPVDDEENIMLVRQYRCGVAKLMLEICAGKLEAGEDPVSCAKRELSEELGITAKCVKSLAHLEPTPAYCGEITYIFLATGLTFSQPHLDEGEFLEFVKMPLSEAVDKVMNGEITDGKTQIAILKAERILGGKN